MTGPTFDASFLDGFARLVSWRRDVRRFRTDPVPSALIEELLDLACLAPSVGNSQPWRFVRVDDPGRRAVIRETFARANAEALAAQAEERRARYARLKLEGLERAPVHLAVFCDDTTGQGHGLGARTMPESRRYSVVAAVHTMWLGARARGLGLGWLSILEPEAVARALAVPEGWRFVAYLCLGWPEEEHTDPELERAGWQGREAACRRVLQR